MGEVGPEQALVAGASASWDARAESSAATANITESSAHSMCPKSERGKDGRVWGRGTYDHRYLCFA